MEKFGFDKVPEVLREIYEKVERLEALLIVLIPNKQSTENELFTVGKAADFLQVSVQSLYIKVSRREIPVSKPGRRLYFQKSELQKWVASGRRKIMAELVEQPKQYPKSK